MVYLNEVLGSYGAADDFQGHWPCEDVGGAGDL